MRQDVVIIGAPRSGTNMLRDVLVKLPGCGTWPCDEINYIWRHGNVRYRSDEFPSELANSTVQSYIRTQFDWVAQRYGVPIVVEKTCANSLRIDFVREVLPEAKFIVIRRDGLDAVGSALKRWTAPLDLPYLIRKTRFVPPRDLPYYASRYLLNRFYRLASKERRLAFWGPRLDDMEYLLSHYSLEEVCAIQWKRCVDSSDRAFLKMSSNAYHEVCYEAFVRSPVTELCRIVKFLRLDVDQVALGNAVREVTASNVGKGRLSLSKSTHDSIMDVAEDTLKRHGYA